MIYYMSFNFPQRWCWRHPHGCDLLRMASFQNNIYHEKDDIRFVITLDVPLAAVEHSILNGALVVCDLQEPGAGALRRTAAVCDCGSGRGNAITCRHPAGSHETPDTLSGRWVILVDFWWPDDTLVQKPALFSRQVVTFPINSTLRCWPGELDGAAAHQHPKTLLLAGHIKGIIHPEIK